MTHSIRHTLTLVLVLALAGCGSSQSDVSNVVLSGLRGLFQRTPDVPSLRERLTPEAVATIDGAILLTELPEVDAEAGAQVVRTGGGHVIWATLNQVQFAFRRGVLTSTRGLQGDLLSADLAQVVPAVHAGRREAVRVHQYLDGEDQVTTRAFVCSYARRTGQTTQTITGTFRTTQVIETCNSTDLEIENHYWIDGRGTVRKSKQWVGPFLGYMFTELIND